MNLSWNSGEWILRMIIIETRLNNPNEMKSFYSQDTDGLITSPSQCPNFDTFVPLLPTEVIILTKQ
ncbi:hypothetical protein AU378_11425 [Chryseobacterium kwangjuense]|uniref:Uncharacterized protein n=1 Tax=Chryseobacterium kwangjuense TaxID=267125 RepID=A0A135WDS0_9FLAO|nr:hypothetical protein AU378_11425 [Chryseobacterium kwangjuense]